MLFTKTAVWSVALLLTAGCTSATPATLCQGNEKQIKVMIRRKTGDPRAAPFVQQLPSGTRVIILDDGLSESSIKIRIEQGEFQGQEATVDRNAIRRAE
jgi:hypothetical protein